MKHIYSIIHYWNTFSKNSDKSGQCLWSIGAFLFDLSFQNITKPKLIKGFVFTFPISQFAYISVCLHLSLPTSQFAYISVCLHLSLPTSQFAYISVCLQRSLPTAQFAYSTVCLHLSLPTCFILPTNAYHFAYIWV